ncbi:hypothetical protein ACIBEJ_36300 [Nonomuraea sp. NPDC050790]|uniref:hypothetical protein n=1 Tax=Nonomuraea sp. NPDC050790 TaxID=3364371 RepID=UPI0037999CC1
MTPHFSGLLAEWRRFRAARGLTLAMVASVLVTVSLGLLVAAGARTSCVTGKGEGPCPAPLLGPDGTAVRDKYFYVHQPLKGDGSLIARVVGMTGQIRLPDAVPGVRNVAEGVVPWAKAGILVRQSLEQGTPYAAVMLTGGHGVRMQHDYVHDVAGGPHNGPQWLRLTRSGELVSGHESDDGRTWTEVGTVRLAGLPETVEIGLFATSPGVLWESAQAFAQVTATFDQVKGMSGPWRHDDVGVVLESDGKTPHHPGAAVESGDRLLVTGGGDIGPATVEGGLRADLTLVGGALGLIPVLVAAVVFGRGIRRDPPAGAAVAGAVAFVAGLVSAGVVVPAGLALLRANQNPIQPISPSIGARVIVGYALLAAVAAVLAVGLAVLVRRAVVAAGLAVGLVVVPHLVAGAGVTGAGVAPWLPAFTPAAGFAITQSVPAYAHVAAGPSPYPLAPWAGLAVACGYAALVLGAATAVRRSRPTARPAVPGRP